jgi:MFS family permease
MAMSTSTTGTAQPAAGTTGGRAWRMLALLATAELLGMSLWFTASAVAPQLAAARGFDPAAVGWLVSAVQLGFVAGTAVAALLNLADIIPARRYVAGAAVLAALSNVALLVTDGWYTALATRFLTGFFLAGVYPPAMKMAATWFRERRGLAIGVIVGALTVGKATPYLLSGIPGLRPETVVLAASLGALAAAVLVYVAYRDGPYPFARRPFSLRLAGTVLADRPTRLAIGGYLGHMWELYAGWATLGSFFFYFFSLRGWGPVEAAAGSGIVAFLVISAGGLGSVLAGVWADRWGRENVAAAAMVVSGACALTLGWLPSAPPWVVISIAMIWGFTIVADSAQFSALVTEVAPAHAVGTALTLQTSLGFLLTALSIGLTVVLASRLGWGIAFSLLAAGPILGVWAMLRLKNIRLYGGQAAPTG